MFGLPAEISPILHRYSRQVGGQGITDVTPHAGFSGARVWRIATTDAAWALRRWPRNALPAARLRGLHGLLEHIQQAGVNCIAVPVADDAGQTLVSHGAHDWQLEPWLSGTADFHRDPNAARLSAVMTALAEWHRAAATFIPADDSRRWFASQPSAPSPAVGERLQLWRQSEPILTRARSAIRKLPPDDWKSLCSESIDLVASAGPKIAIELANARHLSAPLQPCLRDIWHDHVLFTGDAVAGLIDPSACRTESVAADLSRLLGSLIEDDTAKWDAALAAYRRFRPLSLVEESLIGVLDRSSIVLSMLTWLKWLFVEERTFPDPVAVRQRIQTLHRRLVRLAQRT